MSTASGLGLLRPGGEVDAVEGSADAWWLPFRWGRRLPVASAAIVPEDTLEDAEEALDALADSVPPGRIGLLTVGRAGRTSNRSPETSDDPAPGDADFQEFEEFAPRPQRADDAAAPLPELPGGFYAVALSSRQLAALGQMRQLLDRSGYSTHVLRRMDEANDIWYRLLVGPYATRPDAEDAALELRRERGIDAWVHEEGDRAARRGP